MLDCQQVKERGLIEKYLRGELSEAEQEAFEQHYFECARCFEELQTYHALQAELQRAGRSIRSEPIEQGMAWGRAWVAGLAVVLIAVGLALWRWQSTTRLPATSPSPVHPQGAPPQPTPAVPSLSELAAIEPPPYVPATLRGPVDEAARNFRQAMQHYGRADYVAALDGLRAAAKLNPRDPNIRFFLGISYLLTNQTESAIKLLQDTVALGESPYLEEAHFYLAKGFLRQGNLTAAQNELKKTIALQGDLEREARKLLSQLETLSPLR